MRKLYLTVGIPASGKTTWAEEFCKDRKDIVNINRDDIRENLFGFPYKYSKEKEKKVTEYQKLIADTAVFNNKDIVISDTNLNENTRKEWFEWASKASYEVIIKEFDVSVRKAIERNYKRSRPVPESVIHSMFCKWLEYKGFIKYVPNGLLECCVIFDLDGTLAHMTNRGPFDWCKVCNDNLDYIVAEMLSMYKQMGYKIVILSGRDSCCREDTIQWLEDYEIRYDALFMRAAGDTRPDYQVKHEILMNDVAKLYDVLLCVDDRDQVVRMWRWHGIKCFQVQEGNF